MIPRTTPAAARHARIGCRVVHRLSFPRSQTPVWERLSAKLCFAMFQTVFMGETAASLDSPTAGASGICVPKLEFGNKEKELHDANISCSMSCKGNCWDNAPMESFFCESEERMCPSGAIPDTGRSQGQHLCLHSTVLQSRASSFGVGLSES